MIARYKFMSKPNFLDGFRLTRENIVEVAELLGGRIVNEEYDEFGSMTFKEPKLAILNDHTGYQMYVEIGQWIVTVNGRFDNPSFLRVYSDHKIQNDYFQL